MSLRDSSRRTRNLFNPDAKTPFKLSRSRLEHFLNCPRCFYLDRRLGVEAPAIPAFTLNSAVDALLKKEFDHFRRLRQPHPLMSKYRIEAVPYVHPMMDEWRENFTGIQYHHPAANLIIFGAVDDIWVDPQGQLLVVDYKATSTDQPISLDTEYRQAYKRQMEIYQWLLRKQGLKVSDTGYFVYCNGDKAKENFGARLEFKIEIIAYLGSDQWVDAAIMAARQCLMQDKLPDYTPQCPYCAYRQTTNQLENNPWVKAEIQGELF